MSENYVLILPRDFSGAIEEEVEIKGWFGLARVKLPSGTFVRPTFISAVCLAQEVKYDLGAGKAAYAQEGLIVIADVTRTHMEAAVKELGPTGYFESLKPDESNIELLCDREL